MYIYILTFCLDYGMHENDRLLNPYGIWHLGMDEVILNYKDW